MFRLDAPDYCSDMDFTGLGKRAQERIQAAKGKPTTPPRQPTSGQLHVEGDSWWEWRGGWLPYQPTELDLASRRVSAEVGLQESFEEVAASLKRGLMSRGGLGQYTCEDVEYDLATQRYEVTLSHWGNDQHVFGINDEDLQRHTETRIGYRAWLLTVTTDLRKLMDAVLGPDAPNHEAGQGEGGWYEATGTRPPRTTLFTDPNYNERVQSRRAKEEEDAAIESIRRDLGGDEPL